MFDNSETLRKSNEKIAKMVRDEHAWQQALTEKTAILRNAYDKFVPVLAKLGLEIVGLTYRVNHPKDLMNAEDWKGSMNVSIWAKSNGKFRFIKFDGYTASGAGRNQERLSEKAAKIADAISGFGVKFSVNPFSLEIKDDEKEKTVLINGWIE